MLWGHAYFVFLHFFRVISLPTAIKREVIEDFLVVFIELEREVFYVGLAFLSFYLTKSPFLHTL